MFLGINRSYEKRALLKNFQGAILISSFSKLQGIPESGGRAWDFFNFCHKAHKLLSHITKYRAESPNFKDTKYVNYRRKIREKTPLLFP
jgi:hypothetical protein